MREEGKRKGKGGGAKREEKRRNRKREDGGEKGRRNPQTEKKEKMVALELLCYVLDIYTYMSYVCVSKEEIVASGNAAKKKKKGGERTNVAILNAPSHTHRGQPANTNYCKGQASGNADAVLKKKKGFQSRYPLDSESQQGPLVERTPQKGEFQIMYH